MVILALILFLISSIPLIFAALILRVIDIAARQRREPVRLYIVDFFSLIFFIQLPMAIALQTENREQGSAVAVAGIFSALMALVWWTTVKTVSRAGISDSKTRAWISLLVIPMAYVGSFSIIATGIGIGNSQDKQMTATLIAIEILLIGLMVLSWIVTRRAVRQAELKVDSSADDSTSVD